MLRLFTDTSANLPAALLLRHYITVIPFSYTVNGREMLYPEDTDFDGAEFYGAMRAGAQVRTSMVSPDTAARYFEQALAQGDDVLYVGMSGGISGTAQAAAMAAVELMDRYPDRQLMTIDTYAASLGEGLLVLEAAEMAQAGKSGADIVAHVESLIPSVRASFVVDTLTFLHRGGRCSGAAALAGSVLKLHPKIIVKDGKMSVDKKYRGSLAHAISTYTADLHDDLLAADKKRVFITHSGCDREIVEQVRTYLTALHHFDEVIETRAGGVISCHCGPGTLGVLFVESAK